MTKEVYRLPGAIAVLEAKNRSPRVADHWGISSERKERQQDEKQEVPRYCEEARRSKVHQWGVKCFPPSPSLGMAGARLASLTLLRGPMLTVPKLYSAPRLSCRLAASLICSCAPFEEHNEPPQNLHHQQQFLS